MESQHYKSPDFINQKYLELLEKSNRLLHKKGRTFSLKNLVVFSGLFLVLITIVSLNVFDFSQDSFKDHLLTTAFNDKNIIIQSQKGEFYKITKNTNQKWFAKNGLFITVNSSKIIFTDTQNKSHKMNDAYTLWVPKNKQYELVLADGSEIKLNENSQISFNNNRVSIKPQVVLSNGEAFFNVAHKHKQTFNIKASKMAVEVFGTSFNLKNKPNDTYTSVALIDGSVKVSNSLEESIYIKPGEQATIFQNSNNILVDKTALSEIPIWSAKQFYFADETLESILKKLSIWFNKEFIVKNDALNQIRFTGSLKKEEGLIPFLRVLQYTESINYTIKDNNTIILNKTNQNK